MGRKKRRKNGGHCFFQTKMSLIDLYMTQMPPPPPTKKALRSLPQRSPRPPTQHPTTAAAGAEEQGEGVLRPMEPGPGSRGPVPHVRLQGRAGTPAASPSSYEEGEEETSGDEEPFPRPEDRACCLLMGLELGPPRCPGPPCEGQWGTGHALRGAGKRENRGGRKEEEKEP